MTAGQIVLVCIASLLLLALAWVVADVLRNGRLKRLPSISERNRGNENRALMALHEDLAYDSADIAAACAYVDGRNDCADFSMQTLLRIYIAYRDRLRPEDAGRIRRTLLGFKYWMDEPGEDGMCFWSENHQILFAAAEYLAGGLFQAEVFENCGMTGAQHREKARLRILDWLKLRWDYGFSEWYSNVYYVEDAAALANLIDFAGDGEIVQKATIAMDLLLFDIASQSLEGYFVTTSGRLYEGNKKNRTDASTNGIARHAFGLPVNPGGGYGLDANFLLMRGYSVPPVLREIAADPAARAIKASCGLDTSELRREGLVGLGARQIMAQWGMEAFTNPEVINNSLDYINRNGMRRNAFLFDFRSINIGFLRAAGLLPLLSRVLKPQQNGVAIQRANTYAYRTKHYSMYTAQAHHPGECYDQQHIHGVTLKDGPSVFTTHPATKAERARNEDGTPNYWVGGGRLPCSAQERNVNLTVYRLPRRGSLLEMPLLPFTHAWFPKDEFDEAAVDGSIAFGRKGGAYVALIGGSELKYADGSGADLLQRGRSTWWVTEAGSEEDESYGAFTERIRKNRAEFDGRRLVYQSGGHRYELDYGGLFTVDGETKDFRYPRFDSGYARAGRKPKAIDITCNGKSLRLEFDACGRTVE